ASTWPLRWISFWSCADFETGSATLLSRPECGADFAHVADALEIADLLEQPPDCVFCKRRARGALELVLDFGAGQRVLRAAAALLDVLLEDATVDRTCMRLHCVALGRAADVELRIVHDLDFLDDAHDGRIGDALFAVLVDERLPVDELHARREVAVHLRGDDGGRPVFPA